MHRRRVHHGLGGESPTAVAAEAVRHHQQSGIPVRRVQDRQAILIFLTLADMSERVDAMARSSWLLQARLRCAMYL